MRCLVPEIGLIIIVAVIMIMIMIIIRILGAIVIMMLTGIVVRLHNEGAGGAWCPREPVSREKDQQWIQVDASDDDFDDYYKGGNEEYDSGNSDVDWKAGHDDQPRANYLKSFFCHHLHHRQWHPPHHQNDSPGDHHHIVITR